MASNARVAADESSICDCISETYVANLAGELFQSDLISDASYQAAIAEDSVLSPTHKVAHLVFEVVSKVGASPSNYKFIFRPGTQSLGRPGKPHATNVTHNSLVLSWEKPQYGADSVQSYTITYRAKDDPPGRWITQTSQSQLEHTELTHLAVETTYIFKVRAESASGTSGPYSETSDPIETTSYPEELKQLEMLIYSLQPLFRAKLAKTDELRQEKQMLEECEADIEVNNDFTYQVQVMRQRKTNLPAGVYTTNCLKCNYTCHCPCPIPADVDKYTCNAMDNPGSTNACCTVCPGRCSWKVHINSPYRFELYQETETRTYSELKSRYGSAMARKSPVEAIITKMKKELQETDQAILNTIEEAKQILRDLQKSTGYNSVVEYIDHLIATESEKQQSRWNERVSTLLDIRKQVESA